MRVAVACLIVLFATTACAEPAESPPPDVVASAPAAVEEPATPVVQTVSTDGAEAFVRALYASYSDGADAQPWSGDAVWSRRMAGLIARDQALADADMPYLDADPICNCQDWERLSIRAVVLARPSADGSVQASVRFVNAGEAVTSILKLVREPAGWRIDDVLNPGHPGLAAQLVESNRRVAAGPPVAGRD